jgi:hypothetical protein
MSVWAFMTSLLRTSNFVIYAQFGVYKTKLQWINQIPIVKTKRLVKVYLV